MKSKNIDVKKPLKLLKLVQEVHRIKTWFLQCNECFEKRQNVPCSEIFQLFQLNGNLPRRALHIERYIIRSFHLPAYERHQSAKSQASLDITPPPRIVRRSSGSRWKGSRIDTANAWNSICLAQRLLLIYVCGWGGACDVIIYIIMFRFAEGYAHSCMRWANGCEVICHIASHSWSGFARQTSNRLTYACKQKPTTLFYLLIHRRLNRAARGLTDRAEK